jgi:3-hydroxyacyl-[acyl-carrier-protein] dehydratase
VTPGVCLVQMAAEILGQDYQQSLMLSLLKNIKFKKIVHPEDEPTFVFTKVVKAEGMLSANVSIEDEESQYVKMSLQYMCDHSNV